MDNNEFSRRIRYALSLNDQNAVTLMSLGGLEVTTEQASGYRCKEGEPGYLACPDSALLALLDGLIQDRRGPPPTTNAVATDRQSQRNKPTVTNNLVLKQLRIALSLRTDEVQLVIAAGGGSLGKTEIGAFFRNPQARNYRRCGDQVMRWFLAGLAAARIDGLNTENL